MLHGRRRARRYDELLKGTVGTPKVGAGARHVYHMYMIRSPKRDAIAAALAKESIDSAVYERAVLARAGCR